MTVVALVDLKIKFEPKPVPIGIADFLREADARVTEYLEHSRARVTAFVPSDFVVALSGLQSVVQLNVATGNVFCEWGSGMGVVAALASMIGFESYGIEISGDLVDAASELASEFDIAVEFIHGSFIPRGAEHIVEVESTNEIFWLETESDNAYTELGMDADDFDVVFAYPWPGEEHVVEKLFDYCAGDNALLLTYGHQGGMRVQRKVRR